VVECLHEYNDGQFSYDDDNQCRGVRSQHASVVTAGPKAPVHPHGTYYDPDDDHRGAARLDDRLGVLPRDCEDGVDVDVDVVEGFQHPVAGHQDGDAEAEDEQPGEEENYIGCSQKKLCEGYATSVRHVCLITIRNED